MFKVDAKIEYGPWGITKFLGNGASARVYKVEHGGKIAALKIFDPEIFSGDDEAKERLKRQSELIAKHHANLADTWEVGTAFIDGQPAPALLLEFCPGESLEKAPVQKSLTDFQVRSIVAATAASAKYLMDHGYAHRDIKPANIMFDAATGITKLLDTGVIRPLTDPNDVSGYAFVGTKRYSPPEFLYRKEDGSQQCWEAITLYQLGATLYELMFKRPPYSEYKVQAQLIKAIDLEDPNFAGSETFPPDLRHLLLCSLKRDWKTRLKTVSWSDFLSLAVPKTGLRALSKDDACTVSVPDGCVPLRRADEIGRLLASVAENVRQPMLAKKLLVNVHRNGNTAMFSAGRSIKQLTSVERLTLSAAASDTCVAEITHVSSGVQSFFLVTKGDEMLLSDEMRQRLEASI